MTSAERAALERVSRATTGALEQKAVEPADRAKFLSLLAKGLIEEKIGPWSGRHYWELTPAGKAALANRWK